LFAANGKGEKSSFRNYPHLEVEGSRRKKGGRERGDFLTTNPLEDRYPFPNYLLKNPRKKKGKREAPCLS